MTFGFELSTAQDDHGNQSAWMVEGRCAHAATLRREGASCPECAVWGHGRRGWAPRATPSLRQRCRKGKPAISARRICNLAPNRRRSARCMQETMCHQEHISAQEVERYAHQAVGPRMQVNMRNPGTTCRKSFGMHSKVRKSSSSQRGCACNEVGAGRHRFWGGPTSWVGAWIRRNPLRPVRPKESTTPSSKSSKGAVDLPRHLLAD